MKTSRTKQSAMKKDVKKDPKNADKKKGVMKVIKKKKEEPGTPPTAEKKIEDSSGDFFGGHPIHMEEFGTQRSPKIESPIGGAAASSAAASSQVIDLDQMSQVPMSQFPDDEL